MNKQVTVVIIRGRQLLLRKLKKIKMMRHSMLRRKHLRKVLPLLNPMDQQQVILNRPQQGLHLLSTRAT